MRQTLLLSTTDRNFRSIWHKFQPQGGKSTPFTVHTFGMPLLSFVAKSSASGPQSGKAPYHSLPLPDLLCVYISLVQSYHWSSSMTREMERSDWTVSRRGDLTERDVMARPPYLEDGLSWLTWNNTLGTISGIIWWPSWPNLKKWNELCDMHDKPKPGDETSRPSDLTLHLKYVT